MIRAHWTRFALSLAAALALLVSSSDASAQGRCSCNSGCHRYPGQCVQGGSNSGCEAGYAPFCGTRASSCPQTGWVTCNGECTCVRIGPIDGGAPPSDVTSVSDAPPPPRDVPASFDAPMPTDVPASFDAPSPTDVRPGVDAPSPVDAPSGPDVTVIRDGAVPSDAPTPGDRPVTPVDAVVVLPDGAVVVDATAWDDAPATPSDAPIPSLDGAVIGPDGAVIGIDGALPPADVPVSCDGGVSYRGRCLTDRCQYQNELGFICPIADHTCRVLGDEAWCVPACLDVTCEMGSFCDPSTGTCRVDQCATTRCPSGQICRENQCLPAPDGSPGAGPPAGAEDGGCGCRATSHARSTRAALVLTGLAALLRRRRARR